MKYLVLNKSEYDFKNSSGERVFGKKITILDNKHVFDDFFSGVKVMTFNVSDKFYNRIEEVPCVVELEIGMRPSSSGVKATIDDLEFLNISDLTMFARYDN